MPNHVKTVIKFKNLKERDIEFITNTIARPLTPKDKMFLEGTDSYHIDFNKIIPQPRCEEDCPEQYIDPSVSHAMELEDRPWFNWYKWNCANWGVKWNAYDGYSTHTTNSITFVFNTAWSLADPIVNKLTGLGYDFEVRFADECLGSNCGKITFNASTGEQKLLMEDEVAKDSRAWASRIWDRY